jgi:hypothetical protein
VAALRDNTPILEMLAATPGVMESFIEFLSMPDAGGELACALLNGAKGAAALGFAAVLWSPNQPYLVHATDVVTEMISMGLRWASYVLRFVHHGKERFEELHGLTALEDLEYNNHKVAFVAVRVDLLTADCKDEKLFDKANELLHKVFSNSSSSWAHFHFVCAVPWPFLHDSFPPSHQSH